MIRKVVSKLLDWVKARLLWKVELDLKEIAQAIERLETLVGHLASQSQNATENKPSPSFRVFSQWDEDGIIQQIIRSIEIPHETFIEIGIEDYRESNTKFLLLHNNWQGYLIDSDAAALVTLKQKPIAWKYDLQTASARVTRENINELLQASSFPPDLGLLSIDIDGNDYWVWERIEKYQPRVVIIEYNSLFGFNPVVVPYASDFDRTTAHCSQQYWGASLTALNHLAARKGYSLIETSIGGGNAFFVRTDCLGSLQAKTPESVFKASKVRDSRDADGQLNFLRGSDRILAINDLPVVNILSGETLLIKNLPGIPTSPT